jgi:hypothetical protein
MRRWAFVLMIVGMFILFLFLIKDPVEVDSYSDLEELEINQMIIMKGELVSERIIYEGTKLFGINNDIELICECLDNYEGKEIEVVGVVEEYNGRKQVRVSSIREIL